MKKALLVGINYPNTDHALRGCVNDVNIMADILINNFGFKTKNIRMLTDHSATTENILERLNWLVSDLKLGDVIYFHYSGHGSQYVDTKYDTDDEPDGLDEVLVPIDMNWRDKMITDDQLKAVFDRVPPGVKFTVVLDCCHSGSGLDQDQYFRPLGLGEKREFDSPNRSRELEMPADIANRARGLKLKQKSRQVQTRDANHVGVLISGCQPHQTSADAWIHDRYVGACTYFLAHHLTNHDYNLTYQDLVTKMNMSMQKYGYSQRPELNGSSMLWGQKFLEDTSELFQEPDEESD